MNNLLKAHAMCATAPFACAPEASPTAALHQAVRRTVVDREVADRRYDENANGIAARQYHLRVAINEVTGELQVSILPLVPRDPEMHLTVAIQRGTPTVTIGSSVGPDGPLAKLFAGRGEIDVVPCASEQLTIRNGAVTVRQA